MTKLAPRSTVITPARFESLALHQGCNTFLKVFYNVNKRHPVIDRYISVIVELTNRIYIYIL